MGRIMTGHMLLSLFGGLRNLSEDQTSLGGTLHKGCIYAASAPTSAMVAQARTCGFHSRMSCIYTDGHPTARTRVRISYKLKYMPTFSSANNVRYQKNSANLMVTY